MIKVILTKIESNHTNLRTDVIEGETAELPTQGKDFVLLGEGLEFGTRIVRTTPIREILKFSETLMEFKTQNSRYKLEIVGE